MIINSYSKKINVSFKNKKIMELVVILFIIGAAVLGFVSILLLAG
jgi:hypothetical protein